MFSALNTVIEKLSITILFTTPTIVQTLLRLHEKDEGLSSLRILCLGGEAMKPHVKDAWQDRVALFNCYGPSEYFIPMGKRMKGDVLPTNIGQAFGKNRAYVLRLDDKTGKLDKAATGEEGELYLAGMLSWLSKHK